MVFLQFLLDYRRIRSRIRIWIRTGTSYYWIRIQEAQKHPDPQHWTGFNKIPSDERDSRCDGMVLCRFEQPGQPGFSQGELSHCDQTEAQHAPTQIQPERSVLCLAFPVLLVTLPISSFADPWHFGMDSYNWLTDPAPASAFSSAAEKMSNFYF